MLSAIIPAYNEERTVAKVVNVVLKSKVFSEVICVNDGSTDKTLKILKGFGNKIKIINLPKNKGKAGAIAEAVKRSRGEIVVFLDADLVGLKKKDLVNIVRGLVNKKYDCILASTNAPELVNTAVSIATFSPFKKDFDALTGQRAFYKKDLLPLLKDIESIGYGLEVYLNDAFRNKNVGLVKLSGVTHLLKPQKSTRQWYGGMWVDLYKQVGDIGKELLKQKVRPAKEFATKVQRHIPKISAT